MAEFKDTSPALSTATESTDQLTSLSANWCFSKSTTIVCPFVWAIENFSFFLDKDDATVHRSTMFPDQTLHLREWYLTMECRKKSEKERQVLFTVRMIAQVHTKLKAKIKFTFFNWNGKSLIEKESEDICIFTGNDQGWSWNIPHTYLTDIVKSNENNIEDKFIVKCQVTLLIESTTLTSFKRKSTFDIPHCRLVDDYSELYRTRKYADLIVSVAGVEFPAHKVILASRCAIFAAMFECNMKESAERRIVIEDISPPVFEQMLRYIYTGKVDDIEKHNAELLIAANKYGLDRLKALCEESITLGLTVDNVASILVLADMHNATQLKDFVVEFINKEPNKVLKTNSWKRLVQPNGQLVSEVFNRMVEKIHCPSPTKRMTVEKLMSSN